MRAIPTFSSLRSLFSNLFILIAVTSLLGASALGQESTVTLAPQPLITQPVDESQLTTLKGNTHPLARPQFDLGTAPASLPMERMLLVLKRSPAQESALRKLLDDQQDKASPNYHKWLTPEEFGKQFGPTDADMQTITLWLQSHGFQVGSSKGRAVLEFSGSASQVQEAFHAAIHKYIVKGEQHWANASDPMIPTALTGAVAGVEALNNFPRRPMNQPYGLFSRDKSTGKLTGQHTLFTYGGGCDQDNNCYAISPYDFATIYNLLPLWNAGVSGQSQTIAIVGESNINPQDVSDFRTMFGLVAKGFPVNPVNIILNGPDPGPQGDESEADIDVQWSSAAAPNATIDFVVSESTETTRGVDLSAVYIVEKNLAPVMSESYGICELGLGTTGNQFFNALWQQASAQGITVFVASGDSGSAVCDRFEGSSPEPAQFGLAVSGFASTPYNVAVGGTDFNDVLNPGTYWNTTNDATTQASAKGYIPETTWNDSCTNGILASFGWSSSAETNCNDSRLSGLVWTVGGSGGASNCTTPSGNTVASCGGGYGKPSWQSGAGVPNDGKRDVPDVSLFASNGFMGNFYVICQADSNPYHTCNASSSEYFEGFGGTSVSSPAMAGIMALVNQQTGERQGNANYVLYKLAAKSGASCTSSASESSNCIFNDVTSGTIAMPCKTGSPNCTTSTSGHAYGILSGYSTGAAYDRATGLGSVNAQNLVTQWSSISSLPSTTTLTSLTPTTITHGQAVSFSVTVAPQSGTGTPTGTISLQGGPTSSSEGIAGFSLTNGTASGSTDLLPGGTYSVTAHYPGDATYGLSDSSPVGVTVGKENSSSQVFLVTFDYNGNIVNGNATSAVYGSPYLLRTNVENSAGSLCTPVENAGAAGCPTGSVTLTDNGSALDGGSFALNPYGYFEDQTIQLPGGANSVKAAYAGDNSFKASSATTAITISPAPTTGTLNSNYVRVIVGQQFYLYDSIQAESFGAFPTGAVTFLDNGSPMPGTVTYQSLNCGNDYFECLNATLITSVSTSGTHTITANYPGDGNYAAASATLSMPTLYQPTATLNASAQTVTAGSSVTLTAVIDANVKTPALTGTVAFVGAPTPITATPTVVTTTDSHGNSVLQATLTITVNSSETVTAQYTGDANYAYAAAGVNIAVPDFSVFTNPTQITVIQGQSQTAQTDISSLGGFSGTISFTCPSGLPAESTCSFNPAQIQGQGWTTLTIATTPLGQSRRRTANSRPAIGWTASTVFLLVGVCLIGIPARDRRRASMLALMIVSLMLAPSCGGGGGGGGGGGTNNPVPAISSLSPAQQAAGSQSQQVTINGSGFVNSSTVTYNNSPHTATFKGTSQLAINLTGSDVAATGSFPIVVTNPTPGGGTSNSEAFNVVAGTPTGTFNVTVTASSGSLSHSTTIALVVQ